MSCPSLPPEVSFALPPEGTPKPDKPMGAVLSFERVLAPGTYQVTLSDEAWIDIVQNRAYQPSLEFSCVHGCPACAKVSVSTSRMRL
jgi:hypothetical protein